MFILRTLIKQKEGSRFYHESNTSLGDSYSKVNEDGSEEFEELINMNDYYKGVKDKIYGFIIHAKGQAIPLYKNQLNFIMTENGATFEKI